MSRDGRRRWGVWQHFIIGKQDNPMMDRLRLIQTPWFGIYVHFIYREDLDPIPHDHPWNFWRFVLRGGYYEYFISEPKRGWGYIRKMRRWRLERFPVTSAHRITSVMPGTISLVVVGRKQRVWGFWTPEEIVVVGTGWGIEGVDEEPLMISTDGRMTIAERRWIDYRDALGLRPTEGVS